MIRFRQSLASYSNAAEHKTLFEGHGRIVRWAPAYLAAWLPESVRFLPRAASEMRRADALSNLQEFWSGRTTMLLPAATVPIYTNRAISRPAGTCA